MAALDEHRHRHLLVHGVVFGEQDLQGVARLRDRVAGDEHRCGSGGRRFGQHGAHRLNEVGPRYRLGQIGLDAHVPAALAIAALPRRCEDQELGRRQLGIGPNGGGEREAVEVGHLGVQDGEVVRRAGLHAAAQRVQPRVGARGLVDGDPLGAQHVPEDAPVGLVVIHQQAPPAQGRRGAPGPR